MIFPFFIAKRYLFSKKSYDAINIISLIAVCGIAITTMVAVCTLSIFNGFQKLISDTFSLFDPELKIISTKGKVFNPTIDVFVKIRRLPEIALISETLEDNVLIKYQERQISIMIKGVSDNFNELIPISNILFDGRFQLIDEIHPFAIVGIGVAKILKVSTDFIFPLSFYSLKRNNEANYFSNPTSFFNQQYAYISGIFMINQPEYDDNYVIVPIKFARQLLDYQIEVSALEIRLKNDANISSVKKKIQKILQKDYLVKDRYEQQLTAFNMIHIEKFVTFLLLCFIILIATFNLVSSLAMLMLDKQKDIDTFRFLGAENKLIARIFFLNGWLVAVVGCFIGIFLGWIICFGQQYFGWIQLRDNSGTFFIDTYPVLIKIVDLVLVFFTVLIISFLSIFFPIKYGMDKRRKES